MRLFRNDSGATVNETLNSEKVEQLEKMHGMEGRDADELSPEWAP